MASVGSELVQPRMFLAEAAMSASLRSPKAESLTVNAIASALTPLSLWLFVRPAEAALYMLLTAMLWIMHRANIARLMAGTEGKIGKKA